MRTTRLPGEIKKVLLRICADQEIADIAVIAYHRRQSRPGKMSASIRPVEDT